ncbi:substrate-binding periplasmic protein [Piscinibacter terrae]|uniref:Solute-binding protein family 3/N-terminal domain-containing protein n=1 Tax=Piscinibacter terrae TaxID=2496871 RepID=A0A3N7HTE6_9BURK|nr:transporter substrate-binding domain-containing protein [Albitalea terrae]RQP25588.1 hypothetical protein DZC73_00460 [Albitalea terrae]
MRWWMGVMLLGLWLAGEPQALAQASTVPTYVVGTTRPEDSVVGQWTRDIYTEAFRRMGAKVRFEVHPVMRLGQLLDNGDIDVEASRGFNFAKDLPSVIRVEEPIFEMVPALFVIEPSYQIKQLSELADKPWRVAWPRGLVECERPLVPLLSPDRVVDVGLTEQAVKMLLTGRVEFICGLDIVVLAMPRTPEYRGMSAVRKLIDVADVLPLYPHLNKRHKDIAPLLAATLRQMKAEGLVQRYRQEAFKRFGAT